MKSFFPGSLGKLLLTHARLFACCEQPLLWKSQRLWFFLGQVWFSWWQKSLWDMLATVAGGWYDHCQQKKVTGRRRAYDVPQGSASDLSYKVRSTRVCQCPTKGNFTAVGNGSGVLLCLCLQERATLLFESIKELARPGWTVQLVISLIPGKCHSISS